ncbi:Sec23/Sec24 trunk domain containing protein [Tritrichomonas foetus]|uniref:Sec23/Sec24 trunk domain containing protein n=1 Tax=Tritrichomonas foetus TaxID=1144522 RepID=A0A1J4KP00_9EUKA|nr:Sec23/Sec24 trunk domain containing protein [Tritrichomonas foetus]|eukprot:OHT11430.1 Sec23/Sec24 trunk domain containing protein [Tritrichomonas foetus]
MSRSRRYVIPEMNTAVVAPTQTTPDNTSSYTPNLQGQPVQPAYPTNYQIPQQQQISEPVFPWENPELLNPTFKNGSTPFPPYFRTISSIFPATPECCQQCKIPFGITVSPAAVSDVPVVEYYKDSRIPRCSNCSGYICTQCHSQTINGQPAWTCALCGKTNVFNNSFANGYGSFNMQSLIELQNPVYDIIASSDYIHMRSQQAFTFIIDMSFNSYSIGITRQFLASLKASLDSIPDYCRVCIIAMSSNISVFDLRNAREIVFPDLSDLLLNVNQENLMPPLSQCKQALIDVIDMLSEQVPLPHQGHCIMSALLVAEKVMTGIGGIILTVFSKLPKEGPYKLYPRTAENEAKLLRLPEDGSGKVFREGAFRLNRACISVHLFCASDDFCDLSSIAIPSGLTCGECHFYGRFDETQRAKMHVDIFATLTNQYCWDASLRLRTSPGIKLVRPHTNCTLKSGDLVSFPVIAREDAIVFELTVEKEITHAQALFQLALVHSTSQGERRIRVFTFTSPLSRDPAAVISSVDEATLASIIARRTMTGILASGPVEALAQLRKDLTQMYSVRNPNFKSLLYIVHGLMSNLVLRPVHPLGVDGRMSTIIKLRAISLIDLLLYLYPRMYAIDTSNSPLPLSYSSFGLGCCFVFHTVDRIYIWVNNGATPEYLMGAFGVNAIEQVPLELPTLNTPENQAIQALIQDCCTLSGRYLPNEVMIQGSPREYIINEIVTDDSKVSGITLTELMNELKYVTH